MGKTARHSHDFSKPALYVGSYRSVMPSVSGFAISQQKAEMLTG
jgi:hypothetical protein